MSQSATTLYDMHFYDLFNFSVSENSLKKGLRITLLSVLFFFQFNCLITNCLFVFLKEGKVRNTSLVHINQHSCLSTKCF